MTVRTAAATPEHDVGSDASLAYLLGRVALLEVAVRGAAARRSHDDPDPTDSLRGVYLSDDYVGWLLDRHATGPADQAAADLAAMRDQLEREADGAEARGYDVRLRRLRRDAALTPLEEDLLVVALAPMIDQRFGQLFGYLNDDVTRRYATISLATELARHRHPADPRDWMLLRPGSRLVDRGLVEVTDPEQPLPTRSVRVAERVLAFLVGDDTASPEIADLLVEPTLLPLVDPGFAGWAQPRSALVRQGPGTDAEVEAATWLASGGPAPLVARLTGPVAELHDLVRQLLRECLLLRRPLVVGPVSRRTLGEGADRLERLLPSDTVVVLWTDVDEAARPGEGLDRIDLAVPSVEHRTRAWRLLCPEGGLAGSGPRAAGSPAPDRGRAHPARPDDAPPPTAGSTGRPWSAASGRRTARRCRGRPAGSPPAAPGPTWSCRRRSTDSCASSPGWSGTATRSSSGGGWAGATAPASRRSSPVTRARARPSPPRWSRASWAWTSTPSTSRGWSTSTSARPRRTSTGC